MAHGGLVLLCLGHLPEHRAQYTDPDQSQAILPMLDILASEPLPVANFRSAHRRLDAFTPRLLCL